MLGVPNYTTTRATAVSQFADGARALARFNALIELNDEAA
jgi:hypothetical protein